MVGKHLLRDIGSWQHAKRNSHSSKQWKNLHNLRNKKRLFWTFRHEQSCWSDESFTIDSNGFASWIHFCRLLFGEDQNNQRQRGIDKQLELYWRNSTDCTLECKSLYGDIRSKRWRCFSNVKIGDFRLNLWHTSNTNKNGLHV